MSLGELFQRPTDLRIISILLGATLFVLICLAIASAQEEYDSVDQYISYSRGEVIPIFDPRFPADPRSSRHLWETGNVTTNQTEGVSVQEATVTAPSEPMPVETVPSPFSGRLSLMLEDSSTKEVNLTLFEVDQSVFGHGTMKVGQTTWTIAAAGDRFADGGLSLDLLTFGNVNLYRLSLEMAGNSASGEYQGYSANGQTWSGHLSGEFYPLSG